MIATISFLKKISDADLMAALDYDRTKGAFMSDPTFRKINKLYQDAQRPNLFEDEKPHSLHYQDIVAEAARRWLEGLKNNA